MRIFRLKPTLTALTLSLPLLALSNQTLARDAEQPFMLGKTDINTAQIRYRNAETGTDLSVDETRALVKRLAQTQALNQSEINTQLGLDDRINQGAGFVVSNPYYPRTTDQSLPLPKQRSVIRDGQEVLNPEGYADPHQGYSIDAEGRTRFFQQTPVTQWYSDVTHSKAASHQVCAVKFSNAEQTQYEMRTFPSAAQAELEGWTITHQYQCGTCSTLQDLAVYIGVPNQTRPIAACTQRAQGDIAKLPMLKQCIVEAVGFTEMCAESWAYNGVHTRTECNNPDWPPLTQLVLNTETGKLHPRLWCDEKISGPGFKYSAGRTRRGSGLGSAIPRPNDTLFYKADHSRYFTE